MLAETICSAVSAAGLGIAAITAYRKKYLSAARIAGWSLVPLGLVMTGAVEWAFDTVFSPVAWAGFGVLGVAWLLLLTTRGVERRRGGRKAAEGGARREAVAPGASSPASAAAPAREALARPASGTPARGGDAEDFSDIEAILKKHGI
ncbi:hypothetical protein HHL19_25485 [Streptomyces sp. R302]|uniref:hypothetical protein n=1 Tax=unclassified Streptomyces TaxID=2593676 RepID=UPI00145EA1A7|nr:MULTISPECIES: hypothetical protein [unclassified Streptomyces]NML53551.1 hypothetical protein [Streptomyces sp. R301]NML81912.1 hypothetical protein [Streptomyces sp. R302]